MRSRAGVSRIGVLFLNGQIDGLFSVLKDTVETEKSGSRRHCRHSRGKAPPPPLPRVTAERVCFELQLP